MKKKQNLLGIFPAVLPLLFQTLDWHKAFLLGGLVAFTFWATVFLFSLTRAFFPRPVAMIAPFLWMASLAQSAWYLGLEPLWILSLFLLLPFSFVKRPPRYFPKEPADFFWIRRGLGFWALLFSLALVQELLEKGLGLLIFREPAGTWMLLGVVLVFWPGLSGVSRTAATVKAGLA